MERNIKKITREDIKRKKEKMIKQTKQNYKNYKYELNKKEILENIHEGIKRTTDGRFNSLDMFIYHIPVLVKWKDLEKICKILFEEGFKVEFHFVFDSDRTNLLDSIKFTITVSWKENDENCIYYKIRCGGKNINICEDVINLCKTLHSLVIFNKSNCKFPKYQKNRESMLCYCILKAFVISNLVYYKNLEYSLYQFNKIDLNNNNYWKDEKNTILYSFIVARNIYKAPEGVVIKKVVSNKNVRYIASKSKFFTKRNVLLSSGKKSLKELEKLVDEDESFGYLPPIKKSKKLEPETPQ